MFTYVPNPDNFPLTISLVDDSTQRSTANLTSAEKDIADRTAYLGARSRGLDSLNWSSTSVLSGGSATYQQYVPAVWDGAFARWLTSVAVVSGSASYILQATDGLNWSPLGASLGTVGGALTVNGLATRPTDGVTLAVGINGGASATWTLDPVALSWSSTANGAFSGATIYNGTYYDGGTGGVFLFWGQGSTTTGPVWSTNGVTWTAATFSPPASFANSPNGFCQSLGRILIFPDGTSVVSEYMISNDGKTWSQATMPTLGAGESVVGAAWDSTTGLYLLLTSTSTASTLWSSTNGASGTFTLLHSFTHRAYHLATTHGEFIVTLSVGGKLRVATSLNGGVLWSLTNFSAALPSGQSALRSSGGQYLYWDDAVASGPSVQASMIVGPAPALII